VELIRYEAMCHAIAECERVDEVKDLRDKALALQTYWRQARNLEAELQAGRIRLRAERRTGELLKELGRAPPQERNPNGRAAGNIEPSRVEARSSPYARTLAEHGIPRTTAQRFEALADVPAETFEAALAEETPTTASAIIERVRSTTPRSIDPDALWLWGRLKEFDQRGLLEREMPALIALTPTPLREDMKGLAFRVACFLNALEKLL
jgi:hypothetical protein